MKTDLATSIITGIVGAVIAYFITGLFIGPIEDVTYKTIDTKVNATLINPDPEVFNYRALNPTVEVYVGECDEYNEYGECIDKATIQVVEDEEIIEETEVIEEQTEEQVEEENKTETKEETNSTPSDQENP